MPEVRERTNGYVCGIVHGGGILLHCGCLTLLALPPRTRTVLLQTSQWCYGYSHDNYGAATDIIVVLGYSHDNYGAATDIIVVLGYSHDNYGAATDIIVVLGYSHDNYGAATDIIVVLGYSHDNYGAATDITVVLWVQS